MLIPCRVYSDTITLYIAGLMDEISFKVRLFPFCQIWAQNHLLLCKDLRSTRLSRISSSHESTTHEDSELVESTNDG